MDLSNIKWTPISKFGDEWRREWSIPTELRNPFFSYWRVNRDALKSKGYGVYKEGDDWILTDTRFKKESFSEEELKDSSDSIVSSQEKRPEGIPLKIVAMKDNSGLRPWQIAPATKLCAIIKQIGCAIDGSDLGSGKTYSACAVARELDMKILVVCPKAVRESWSRVVKNHFKMEDRLVGVINYEMLRKGHKDSEIASYVRRRDTRKNEFVWKIPKNTLIIWDESQKLKGAKTKNSETCIAALEQGYKMLFCSATNATNPLELRTVGAALKLFKGQKQYYTWLYAHGVKKGRFGFEFNGNEKILKELNQDIFVDRGVRLTRDSIPNFPDSQIIAECYDMDDATKAKINSIYAEMSKELAKLKKKNKKDAAQCRLTEILRARQSTELLKVPLFLEMIEEGLENGMSVVVFVNFTETLHAIAERIGTQCIVNGEIKYEKVRQKNIDDFQSDKERVILVNIAAGGAGLSLHDLNGKYPRMSLISPSYSAIMMRQATGRVWRDGGKSKSIQKILFVSNTIEEKVCESVRKKLDNLDLLNDGDLGDGLYE